MLDLAIAFEPPEVRLERGEEFEVAHPRAQVDRDLVHVQGREAYVVRPALPGERRRYRARMATPPIDIVLFDLGGVLIEFGGVEAMRALAGIDSDDELWRRWLTCRWVRSLERGECSPADFARGMVHDWALAVEPETFLDAFRSWPGAQMLGADALVRRVGERVPVGCLSNTNVLHWDDHLSRWPFLELFDFLFASFELGFVKPDREIFDRVADLLGVPPARILFLDDNAINVDAAAAVGFVARHVRGVADAELAIAEYWYP